MTQPDSGAVDGAKTFTQAEVDAIVRERLKRERENTATKYADYDDLKAKAMAADSSKSQLDKMQEQLTALTDRAVKAERTNLRSDVARAKNLPDWMARRLHGTTKEELEADADDMLANYKPSASNGSGGETEGEAGQGGGQQGGDGGQGDASGAATAVRSRPRENLRSGAPLNPGEPPETNPLKLAALIPRG